MADYSFVTPPSGQGYNRYCDIVKAILEAHATMKAGLYVDESTTPKSDLLDALNVICNLTNSDQSGPSGYNIDENGETVSALAATFKTLSDDCSSANALNYVDGRVRAAVKVLQNHLNTLINDSDNTQYSSVNNYYYRNIFDASRAGFPAANLLTGGYYFNSTWQRLSAAAGVPYSTVYDA